MVDLEIKDNHLLKFVASNVMSRTFKTTALATVNPESLQSAQQF